MDNIKPYYEWEVCEGEVYKLKLTTSDIVKLEEVLKRNLLTFLSDTTPLSVMLKITHKSMSKFHHGVKESDVIEMFDRYIENGGSQVQFLTTVFTGIYTVSGFLPASMSNEMEKTMEEANTQL